MRLMCISFSAWACLSMTNTTSLDCQHTVSYTHRRAHETTGCRLLRIRLEKYLEQKHPHLQRNPVKSELPQLWVHRGESRYPFSKGMLSQSITSAGISPGKAYLISRQIEQDLTLLGKMEIKSEELIQLVQQQLQAQFNPDIARTYEVASQINDLPHPVILYVAGAPGTGKSTLAQALASRLGILNVVGTDSIREVMRLSFSKELSLIHI